MGAFGSAKKALASEHHEVMIFIFEQNFDITEPDVIYTNINLKHLHEHFPMLKLVSAREFINLRSTDFLLTSHVEKLTFVVTANTFSNHQWLVLEMYIVTCQVLSLRSNSQRRFSMSKQSFLYKLC